MNRSLLLLQFKADSQCRRLVGRESLQQIRDLTSTGAETVEVIGKLNVVGFLQAGKDTIDDSLAGSECFSDELTIAYSLV